MLFRIIDLYSMVVLIAVLVSWFQLPPRHPVRQVLDTLTEPALKPIRKILPPMGGLDFSPIVLLFGLHALKRLLIG